MGRFPPGSLPALGPSPTPPGPSPQHSCPQTPQCLLNQSPSPASEWPVVGVQMAWPMLTASATPVPHHAIPEWGCPLVPSRSYTLGGPADLPSSASCRPARAPKPYCDRLGEKHRLSLRGPRAGGWARCASSSRVRAGLRGFSTDFLDSGPSLLNRFPLLVRSCPVLVPWSRGGSS